MGFKMSYPLDTMSVSVRGSQIPTNHVSQTSPGLHFLKDSWVYVQNWFRRWFAMKVNRNRRLEIPGSLKKEGDDSSTLNPLNYWTWYGLGDSCLYSKHAGVWNRKTKNFRLALSAHWDTVSTNKQTKTKETNTLNLENKANKVDRNYNH